MDENSQLTFRIFSECGKSIANLDNKGKEKIKEYLIKEEGKRDLLWRFNEGIYSTESDDYLYLYYTLYRLREGYNINYDMDFLSKYFSKEELEQNDIYNKSKTHKIPYVHLKINVDKNCGGRSDITKWGENEEIYYLEFDYKFIIDYLNFIVKCFDPLFNNENKPELERCYLLTLGLPIEAKESLLQALRTGIPYMLWHLNDKEYKLFNLKGQGRDNKWLVGEVPQIYKTKGFEKFCTNTNYLISDLLDFAVNCIMAHELGHIGKGHIKYVANNLNLVDENQYIKQMLEFDADTAGLIWVLGIDFLDGVDGPFDRNINLTLDDLIEHLELKVFAYYTVLRWKSLEDEAIWDNDVVKEENYSSHPKIQLRIMQMLINAFQRLDEILDMSNMNNITTKDNKRLTKEIIENIKMDILQMIADFENVYTKSKTHFDLGYILRKFEELSVVTNDNLKKCYELWSKISGELKKYSYCNVTMYNIDDLK